jgi:hypothetical protein
VPISITSDREKEKARESKMPDLHFIALQYI